MPFTSGKQAFLEISSRKGVEVMFGNPGTRAAAHGRLARETRIPLHPRPSERWPSPWPTATRRRAQLAAVNVHHLARARPNAMGLCTTRARRARRSS